MSRCEFTAPRLERYVLGELSAADRSRTEALLVGDLGLRAELTAIQASDRDILQRYLPRAVAAKVLRRAPPPLSGSGRLAWCGGAVALGAAAALLVVSMPVSSVAPAPVPSATSPEITRAKGLLPHLLLHLKRGDSSRELPAGSQVRAGDLIQIGYVAGGHPFGLVVSLDGNGAVTLHHPERTDRPATLEAGGEALLRYSYELDDAPHYERFIFVTAQRPIDVERTLDAARSLAGDPERARDAPLVLPADIRQHSIVLEKATP